MSKYAEGNKHTNDIDRKQSEEAVLEALFARNGGKPTPWHYALLKQIPHAYKVHAWFCNAQLKDTRLYYDGASPRGSFAYDWVKKNYQREIATALGAVEVCLARERTVIKSFSAIPPAPKAPHGE